MKRSTTVQKQLALEGLRQLIDAMVPRVKQVMKQTRARIFRGHEENRPPHAMRCRRRADEERSLGMRLSDSKLDWDLFYDLYIEPFERGYPSGMIGQ